MAEINTFNSDPSAKPLVFADEQPATPTKPPRATWKKVLLVGLITAAIFLVIPDFINLSFTFAGITCTLGTVGCSTVGGDSLFPPFGNYLGVLLPALFGAVFFYFWRYLGGIYTAIFGTLLAEIVSLYLDATLVDRVGGLPGIVFQIVQAFADAAWLLIFWFLCWFIYEKIRISIWLKVGIGILLVVGTYFGSTAVYNSYVNTIAASAAKANVQSAQKSGIKAYIPTYTLPNYNQPMGTVYTASSEDPAVIEFEFDTASDSAQIPSVFVDEVKETSYFNPPMSCDPAYEPGNSGQGFGPADEVRPCSLIGTTSSGVKVYLFAATSNGFAPEAYAQIGTTEIMVSGYNDISTGTTSAFQSLSNSQYIAIINGLKPATSAQLQAVLAY